MHIKNEQIIHFYEKLWKIVIIDEPQKLEEVTVVSIQKAPRIKNIGIFYRDNF